MRRHRLRSATGSSPLDLIAEAYVSLVSRPVRSLLTAAGTAIGVAAFVAVLGLTSTTSARISERFDALRATEVQVVDDQPENILEDAFPDDTEHRLATLNGVRHAGQIWSVASDAPVSKVPPHWFDRANRHPLVAAQPGALDAAGIHLMAGRSFDSILAERTERVAVIGASAAQQLGITTLDQPATLFIADIPFTVLGIVDETAREPSLLLSVIVPTTTARSLWPHQKQTAARVLIETDQGAAQLIGRQAPLALRPQDPKRLSVQTPPDPKRLRNQIESDVNGLFLLLAAICLIIGAVGITNSTVVSVLERVPEIGLRRAIGARRSDIARQFLVESISLGLFGGIVGAIAGVLTVVTIALLNGWTTVIGTWVIAVAPTLGATTGLIAGVYPSLKAARIVPVEALRR